RLFLWKRNYKLQITNNKQILNSQPAADRSQGGKSQIFPLPPTPSPLGRGWGEGENDFYETININNGEYKEDFSKVDESCDCYLCQNYSRAYLHHLFASKEPLAMHMASIHNLKFYSELMENMRTEI
ncbi:MAG: tRNA-guanine transglycosylase, partial [bacterium]|nr:tRNA-guanine transglycosylase [bacterium]